MMEMYQIRYMLTASRTLNFTRAAAECSVSQPALTKAIKALEEELGAPLFFRESKGLKLSDFGKSVLPHLRQIMTEADVTQTLAANYRLLNKVPLKLGVMSSVGHVRLARFLSRFQIEHEGVEVAVTEGASADLLGDLERGDIELAVLNPMSGLDTQFHVQDLYRERYIVVFPPGHRLGQLNAVKLGDLTGEPYIDRLACEMREMVTQVCQDCDVELYARFRSAREDWVQAMVLARIGFAFMPEYSVTLPDLMQRPLIDPVVTRTISLVNVPGRKFSPAAAAMVRAAQAFDWPG